MTCAWAYSQAHGVPVTVHLDKKKTLGGQFGNKADSWNEIAALFPGGIHWKWHKVEPASEAEWLAYLKKRGIDAETWMYEDFPGKYYTPGLNIAPLLASFPLLEAAPQPQKLPEIFVTEQWDASCESRRLQPAQKQEARKSYRCPVVTIGGEAQGHLRWSLKHIAHALSKAQFHIGVDSAFFHLAMLYLPMEQIHLYRKHDGAQSHHLNRARANGAVVHDIV